MCVAAQPDGGRQVRVPRGAEGHLLAALGRRGPALLRVGAGARRALQPARVPLAHDHRHDGRVHGRQGRRHARTRESCPHTVLSADNYILRQSLDNSIFRHKYPRTTVFLDNSILRQ
jgi:hypothetical protein